MYLKKLDAYEYTISEFLKLLSLLRSNHEKLLSMDMNNLSESEKNELNALSYVVDNEIEEIQKTIGIKSIYFSKSMLDNILSYLISLYGDLECNNIKDNNDIPKLMESYIQTQTEEMESLINQMGDELGLDNLNQKLFKRIKKGRFRFDV
ncbi:hypothetical protein GCM10026987_29750 [Belliella aquatica]|uniref:Uncharacterized protein n=2 Tax=Belliella aquatica TaxID=1323734 RepID=A0ABQ1MFN6_9BACT|nr:hypothetical protein GCM10010993_16550 [Belliella aquatica]